MSTAGKLTLGHFVVYNRSNSVAVVKLQGEVRRCCVRMMYIVQECGVCCVRCGWCVVGVGV